MVSQEVRFESTQNTDFRWMMGAYFYKQDTDVTFTLGGSQFLPRASRETNINQYGLARFGQAEFLMAQKWRLTLGA
jgi:iron complex outermembrane receptor protein